MKEGQSFTAKIEGVPVRGKIQKEGDCFYLCQDIKDGLDCANKLGFKYSWAIHNGKKYHLQLSSVTNLKLGKVPIYPKYRGKFAGYGIKEASKGVFVFGCGDVILTRSEIKQLEKLLPVIEKLGDHVNLLRNTRIEKAIKNLL